MTHPIAPVTESAIPAGLLPTSQHPDVLSATGSYPFSRLVRAAWESQGFAAGIEDLVTPAIKGEHDPNYDTFSDLAGYESYADWFVGANTRLDVQRIKSKIDRHLANEKVLAEGGFWETLGAQVVAGFANPLNYIGPAGGVYQSLRLGERLLMGASRVGLYAGGSQAADEMLAQMSIPTRTAEQSLFNVGTATVLGGILGGAVSARAVRNMVNDFELNSQLQAVETGPRTPDVPLPKGAEGFDSATGRSIRDSVPVNTGPQDLGAAATRTTGALDQTVGGGKIAETLATLLGQVAPGTRLMSSPSQIVRELVEKLVDLPYFMKKNEQGVASAVSIESQLRVAQKRTNEALIFMQDKFIEHRTGKARKFGDIAKVELQDFAGTKAPGTLSELEFYTEVAKAARRMDAHPIPEVEAAAKEARKVFNAVADKAVEAGILTREQVDRSPQTALSYVNRMYDHNKIRTGDNRVKMINDIAKWYGQEQKIRDLIRTRIEAVFPHAEKVSQSFEKLETLFKEIEAADPGKKADSRTLKQRAEIGFRALKEFRDGLENAEKSGHLGRDAKLAITEAQRIADDFGVALAQYSETGSRVNLRVFVEEGGFTTFENAIKSLNSMLEGNFLNWKGKGLREEQSRALEAPSGAKLKPSTESALRRIMDTNTRLEDQELAEIAGQTVNNILGTPFGRVGYDIEVTMPGFFKSHDMPEKRRFALTREFEMPDELLEPYLVNDIRRVLTAYSRVMEADVALARIGWLDFDARVREINEEFDRLRDKVSDNPRKVESLNKEQQKSLRDLNAIVQVIRGTYNVPADPNALGERVWNSVKYFNYMLYMGGATISSLTDPAYVVMRHGLMRSFGAGWKVLTKGLTELQPALKEIDKTGALHEHLLNQHMIRMADVAHDYAVGSTTLERGIQWSANKFGHLNLLSRWTNTVKYLGGLTAQNRILEFSDVIAKGGKVADDDLRWLASIGIDEKKAKQINAAWKASGATDEDGLRWANTSAWGDRALADEFSAILGKEINMAVPTPGIGDRPLFFYKQLGRYLAQFMSFAISSAQRVTMSGLQRHDAAVFNGAAMAIAMGAVIHAIKTPPDRYPATPEEWMTKALTRSGLGGVLPNLMGGVALAVSNPHSGLLRALGPSGQTAENLLQSVQGAGRLTFGDHTLTPAQTNGMRSLIPGNNLFYLKHGFDAIENAVDHSLGNR